MNTHTFSNGQIKTIEAGMKFTYPMRTATFTVIRWNDWGVVFKDDETGKEHKVTDNVFVDMVPFEIQLELF